MPAYILPPPAVSSPAYTDAQAQAANAAAITAAQAATFAAAQSDAAGKYMTPTGVAGQITAATPSPCSTPAFDTLLGAAGTGTPCMARPDSSRPTAVQRANVTTDASGNFSLTWSRTFTSSTPVVTAKPILGGVKGDCGVTTANATTASGSCWTYQSTVVSVLGATVNPIATAASGVRVMLVGAEPTQ